MNPTRNSNCRFNSLLITLFYIAPTLLCSSSLSNFAFSQQLETGTDKPADLHWGFVASQGWTVCVFTLVPASVEACSCIGTLSSLLHAMQSGSELNFQFMLPLCKISQTESDSFIMFLLHTYFLVGSFACYSYTAYRLGNYLAQHCCLYSASCLCNHGNLSMSGHRFSTQWSMCAA